MPVSQTRLPGRIETETAKGPKQSPSNLGCLRERLQPLRTRKPGDERPLAIAYATPLLPFSSVSCFILTCPNPGRGHPSKHPLQAAKMSPPESHAPAEAPINLAKSDLTKACTPARLAAVDDPHKRRHVVRVKR